MNYNMTVKKYGIVTNHIFYVKSRLICQYEKQETEPIFKTIKPYYACTCKACRNDQNSPLYNIDHL